LSTLVRRVQVAVLGLGRLGLALVGGHAAGLASLGVFLRHLDGNRSFLLVDGHSLRPVGLIVNEDVDRGRVAIWMAQQFWIALEFYREPKEKNRLLLFSILTPSTMLLGSCKRARRIRKRLK